jgi:hypothetical protein
MSYTQKMLCFSFVTPLSALNLLRTFLAPSVRRGPHQQKESPPQLPKEEFYRSSQPQKYQGRISLERLRKDGCINREVFF